MQSKAIAQNAPAAAFVAALVQVVLALAAWSHTGAVDGAALVWLISAAVSAAAVLFVPNTQTLKAIKAVLAALAPVVVALVVGEGLSVILETATPILVFLATYVSANGPVGVAARDAVH